MAVEHEILDEHAQRRRALLLRARKVAVAGPAVAILLEGGLMPKRAAAYQTGAVATPIVTTSLPVVTAIGTGTGNLMLTDRCGQVQPI